MRFGLLVATALSITAGCRPTFKLDKPSKLTCSEPFHTWGGGLSNHVQQGSGGGDFDYVPAAPEVQRIYGAYDLKTGDFFWYEEYITASHIQLEHAVGYGTLWTDGDLSIEYLHEVMYEDDRVDQFDVRELRLGCAVDRRVEGEDGLVEVFEGAYINGGYEYSRSYTDGVDTFTSDGRVEPAGSWSETIDVSLGPVTKSFEEVGDGEGYFKREFVEAGLAQDIEGYWERFLDGTAHAEFLHEVSGGLLQAWEYTIDALGTGDGTLEFGQNRCDLEFVDGDCQRVGCTDNSDGSCSPPVEVPRIPSLR